MTLPEAAARTETGQQKHVMALQIGGYPPPHGGVGIHVEELVRRLRRSSISCSVLTNSSLPVVNGPDPGVYRFGGGRAGQFVGMLRAARALAPDIVHVHMAFGVNAMPWVAAFASLPCLKASLITIHSGLFPKVAASLPPAKKLVWRFSFQQFSAIIAVNPDIRQALLGMGISSAKIHVIPAFFPAEAPAHHSLEPTLEDLRLRCGTLVFTSGFMNPDWGILQAARSLHAIKDVNPGIVIAHSGDQIPEYEREVRSAVPDATRLLLYRELAHDRFLSMLAMADIYIRASQYDGDSLAVREALSLGKVVIASDCATRPAGCFLFRTNSQPELNNALRDVIARSAVSSSFIQEPGSEALLRLYSELLESRQDKGMKSQDAEFLNLAPGLDRDVKR